VKVSVQGAVHPGHEVCKMRVQRPEWHSLRLTDSELTDTGKSSSLVKRLLSI
jgi:hypothetical protein